MRFPIKVGALGIDPCVIMRENCTQNDGRISYKLTGLAVEILEFVCEKMNLTTIFLPPSLNLEFDLLVKEISDVEGNL